MVSRLPFQDVVRSFAQERTPIKLGVSGARVILVDSAGANGTHDLELLYNATNGTMSSGDLIVTNKAIYSLR